MSRAASSWLTISLVVGASIAGAVMLALPGDEAPRAPQPSASRQAAGSAPQVAPHCSFERGETAAFALEATTRDVREAQVDTLRGTLSWEVVDELSPQRWRLRAALTDVSLTQELSLPSERVEGSLAAPFFIELDDACRFVSFGFPREWDARRRQLVQSALLTHEYVVPSSPRETLWSAAQFDGLGDFEARYELAPGDGDGRTRVRRHKAAYDGGTKGAAFGVSVAVVGSKATASFDRERPHWLTASSGLERVQLRVQGELAADLLQKFRLTRDDDRFAPVPAMAPGEADFRDAFDLEIDHGAADDARAAPLSYDEALAAFLGRFGPGSDDPSYAAARELAAWLRGHPDGPARLAAALRDGDIDDAARPALFLGLELSGTEEARAALSELLVDARLDAVDRARAASALSDLGAPTRDTAALLLAQAQTGDAMVASVSVLGLGKMAKRSEDDGLRAYVRDALDEELAAAGDDGRTRLVLDAMGNTGDAAFADELTAHLEAESPTTRQHAAEALGRLDPGASGPRLLERLGEESDPAVRATLVSAYHGPATEDTIALMSDQLATSSSTSERAALIAWLGTASRTTPAAQRQLIDHIHRETDARLMQQIGSYVPAAALR